MSDIYWLILLEKIILFFFFFIMYISFSKKLNLFDIFLLHVIFRIFINQDKLHAAVKI